MTKYVDRPFNIRPLCFWALLVVITILLLGLSPWAAGAFVIVFALALYGLSFTKSKDKVLQFLGTSRAFFITAIVLCMAVILSYGITTLVHTNQKSFAGTHQLAGTVESYNLRAPEHGVSFMTLSGVKFGDKKVGGRVVVFIGDYTDQDTNIEIGSRVSFTSALNASDPKPISVNNRTRYTANVDFDKISVGDKSNEVKHVISRYSKSFLHKYMTDINAGLLHSMLFGDKSSLDGDLDASFTIGGIVHVIAVSGFNVALIVGMLLPFLKLCRVNRKAQLPIVAAVLLFYCYLCDFNFPILRATIMFIVMFFNRIYLRNSDMLSGLCMAGIATLLIFPYALSSWSFQLSYVCMLGIALFYMPTERLLKRTLIKKTPNWVNTCQMFLIRGVSMYVAVNIAIFPLLVKMFGVFPTYGLICNLIFVPILALSFCISLVALLTWVGQILLYPVDWLVTFVRLGMGEITSWWGAQIHISNGGAWFLAYLVAMILTTRFVFVRPLYKYCAAGALFGVYLIGFLV